MSLILVVDDDEIIRDMLYELLSEEYDCQTAQTAEQALARLEVDKYERRAYRHLDARFERAGTPRPCASKISGYAGDHHFGDQR